MNRITLFFCLILLLPLLGNAQEGQKEVWLFLPHFDLHWEHGAGRDFPANAQIAIFAEDYGREVLVDLVDGQQWYRFELPMRDLQAEMDVEMLYRGEYKMLTLPAGAEPVYLSMMEEKLFPLGVDVLSAENVMSILGPRRTEIKGKLAILKEQAHALPEKVSLTLPFTHWGDLPNGYDAALEADLDWKYAGFQLSIQNFASTLAFIKIYERYYPILLSPHDHFELKWDYELVEERRAMIDGRPMESETYALLMQMEEHWGHGWELAQNYFNERYPEGLTQEEYDELVEAFVGNRENRLSVLIDWSQGLSNWYEEYHRDAEDILRLINGLGNDSFEDAVEEAFHAVRSQRASRAYFQQEQVGTIFLAGLLFSLLVLAVTVVLKLYRSPLVTTQRLNFVELAFHGFFWAFVMTYGLIDDQHGYLVFSGPIGVIRFLIPMVAFYLNLYILVPHLLIKRKWGRYLFSLAVLGVLVVFSTALTTIPMKLNSFVWIGGEWHWGNFFDNHHLSPPPEASVVLAIGSAILAPIYGIGRHYLLNRMPKLQQRNQALDAELSQLKNQISPHFFFNSLNTVYGFALKEDSPKTAEAITRLSDLMRFALYQGNQDFVPLETELDYLSDYVDMQRLRLDPLKHSLNFRIEGEAGDLKIAPLLLITLIENAFKHGISMSRESYIYIDLMLLDTGLILTVENSVHPRKLEAVVAGDITAGGLGLVNTQQRLDLLYKGHYEWRVEEAEDRYFTQLSLDLVK
jgi:two-component system LytT family sensor kinase